MSKVLDLVGRRFGKLVVQHRTTNKHGKSRWHCICDCGNTSDVLGSSLISGTESCGCLKKTHFKNLTGLSFNSITIEDYVGKNTSNCFIYKMKCNCGNSFVAEGNDISSGKIKSCGCKRYEHSVNKMKLDPKKSLYKSLYNDYKVKAKSRDIYFELTEDDFKCLILSPCKYCGIEHSNIKKLRRKNDDTLLLYNGVDRVDNEIGYTVSNCVPACRTCNQAKHTLTLDTFLTWVDRVYKHNNKDNK